MGFFDIFRKQKHQKSASDSSLHSPSNSSVRDSSPRRIKDLIQTVPVEDLDKLAASVANLARMGEEIIPDLLEEIDRLVPSYTYQKLEQPTFIKAKMICMVLSKLGEPKALDRVFNKFYQLKFSQTSELVRQAAEAMVALGEYAGERLRGEFMKHLDRRIVGFDFHVYVLAMLRDTRIIEPLIRKVDPIRGDDFFVDCLAAFGTGHISQFVSFLKDEDRYVRETAAEVLGAIGDPSCIPPLLALLRDKEDRVRLKVICALGKFPGRLDDGVLVSFLDDESPLVQKYTILTLKSLNPARLRKELDRIIRDPSRKDYVRKAAEEAL